MAQWQSLQQKKNWCHVAGAEINPNEKKNSSWINLQFLLENYGNGGCWPNLFQFVSIYINKA
jgi:hypothetical protein